MSFTVEQKSQLAKLMATENLTVQHKKIRTARFDPQNRVLYLPVWQNMTGILYDLLCGHEVGHALYTPPTGWHDTVVDKTKPKNYKSFLNVIEDARIEKKVKRKYPGLVSQFKLAYQELNRRDFFNIKDRDVNEMPFIDRLNMYTKSQYAATWIKFSAQEEVLVKKVQALETWDDVIRVTDEVYAYSKDEQLEQRLQDFEEFESAIDDYSNDFEDEDDYGDDYGDEDSDEEEKSEKKSKSDQGKKSDEKSDDTNNGDGNGEEKDDQSKSQSKPGEEGDEANPKEESFESQFNRFKESQESWEDQFAPTCETDDSFRRNESQLLDEKCKEYVYVNVPKAKLENIITPAARVQEQLTKYYNWCVTEKYFSPTLGTKLVNEFKNKNERYIGLLAKEFEMRKAAKAFSKSKLSDTGDIDVGKLASYKFDDNIFRKVMLTPKGKNHGLILLLDKSGSMSNNMAGSIEQILVLAMFCRKVNIPFIVYGFGDSVTAHICDIQSNLRDYVSSKYNSFSTNDGDIDFGNVRLREYMNNKMTNAEFNRCVKNMLLLKRSFEGNRNRSTEVPRPDCEDLSNTPLTQAIVACAEVMKNFKQSNNLDITNLVIVHDGDADYTSRYWKDEEGNKKITYIDWYEKNVILRDVKNKFEITVKGMDNINKSVMEWFSKVTNSKIFGFYLTANNREVKYELNQRYYTEHNNEKVALGDLRRIDYHAWDKLNRELTKKMKTEKFIACNVVGYNSFFIVSGGEDLKTENEEIEIDGRVTASKLKTAFMKMNKKKAINRVLVSKFIQGIAV